MGTDSRFRVPQPKIEVGRGFLTEYWKDEKPLPRIEGIGLPVYYLEQGIRHLLALPTSSVVTVLTIAVSLFLLSGFLVTMKNIDKLITNAGSTLDMTVYVKDSAGEKEVKTFVEELRANASFVSVQFFTKDEALAQFRKELGGHQVILEGLDQGNPLPASIQLVLREDELGIGQIETVVQKLRANAVTEEVIYGSEWVKRIHRVIGFFRNIGFVGLLVILGIVMFLIANTIKLVIYARRQEIAIMKLVGSSDNFIRIPFIIGGVIQGLLGTIIGVMCLTVAFWLVNYQFAQASLFGSTFPELIFLGSGSLFVILFVGVAVGAIGSLFALRQFLDV